jgi:hypothetical protein
MFNAIPQDVAAWLIQGGSVLLLIIVCLPFGLTALGVAGRRRIAGIPEDLRPDGKDLVYDKLYSRLIALGFRPLGYFLESLPFGPRLRTAIFASPDGQSTAGLYRLTRHDEPRLRFLSVFTDGSIVHTKNDEELLEQQWDYLRQGRYTDVVDDVLQFHQEAVARYRDTGRQPMSNHNAEEVLNAEAAFYRNAQVAGKMRRDFAQLVKGQLTILCTAPLVARVMCGPQSLVPWLILAGSCLLWPVFVDCAWRSLAHRGPNSRRPFVFPLGSVRRSSI